MPAVHAVPPAIHLLRVVRQLAASYRLAEESKSSSPEICGNYSVNVSNSDTAFLTYWHSGIAPKAKPVSSIFHRPGEQALLQRNVDVMCDDNSSEDEIEEALFALQSALKQGNEFAARLLFSNAQDASLPASCRKMCLEALAGSRVRELRGAVRILIQSYLNSDDDELAFAAIAAATELPPAARGDLKVAVQPWVAKGGYLGRAASVFMAY